MKNRNINHRDDWKTPEYILTPLKEEFDFDFDPCPINPIYERTKNYTFEKRKLDRF